MNNCQKTMEEPTQDFLIIGASFTGSIHNCGMDAPGFWFDSISSKFVSDQMMNQLLNNYRSAGMLVV